MSILKNILMLNRLALISGVVLFFSVGCSSTQKTVVSTGTKTNATAKGQLSDEQRITLKYMFFNANKERQLGNNDKALELYAQCVRLDGKHHASMYEIAKIYQEQNKLNDALFFAAGASQLDPSNEWYRHLTASLYMEVRLFADGEKEFARLYRDFPGNIDYAFEYAAALITNDKVNDAIKVYDEIERKIGISPELIMEKERLWLQMGKFDKAVAEVERLIASDPGNIRHYTMLVELYQANSMFEKVLETAERMREIDSDSPYMYLALAGYYRSTNQFKKSFENLKQAFSSNELEHELKLQIITSYMPLLQGNPEMMKQGLELAEILASTHSDDAMSLSIYGDFLAMDGKFKEAIVQYRKSLDMDANNPTVWQQLLICHSEQDDMDGMLESADSAISYFPELSIFYLFRGTALTVKKDHKEAVKSLLAGSKLVVDNEYQKMQFYVRLADNYHSLKEHEKSDSYYEKALEIDPDDPLVLNNYSYYLSIRKEKLEKAEKMSRRSNEIRPGEASYEDTYGWILYTMGRYAEAKEWLQKALDHGGASNGTILEHMGDTLFKLGEKAAAAEFWKKAKQTGEYSDFLDKKIQDNQLYE